MLSRRAITQWARGLAGTRDSHASRMPKRVARLEAVPKKMKRFAMLAKRPRPPSSHAAAWFVMIRWSGIALVMYAIAWFAFITNFIVR